jgi:hypothetical protein
MATAAAPIGCWKQGKGGWTLQEVAAAVSWEASELSEASVLICSQQDCCLP